LVAISPVLVLLEGSWRLEVNPGEDLFETLKWLSDEILIAQSHVAIRMEKAKHLTS